MSKCPACNDEFSEEFKLPKVLPCGHTYCLICILGIFQNQKAFVCRECLQAIRDPNVIKTLPNNYAILKCIQQFKGQNQRTRNLSPQTFFSMSTSNPFHDFQDNTISFSSPSFEQFHKSHSPSRMGPSPDSFNLDGWKNYLDDMAMTTSKGLARSFTEPRKSRSRSPIQKINDLEFTDKGVFREKKSPMRDSMFNPMIQQQQQQQQFLEMQDICSIRLCNNPKMYLKGSLQPFCELHLRQFNQFNNQFNPQPQFMGESGHSSQQSQHNFSKDMGNPFGSMLYNGSTTASTGSQHSNSQPFPNSQHETPLSQDSNKSFHKFGKPSAFELMRFYDKTPAHTKANSMNSSFHNRSNSSINSSVFASFGPKDNQSIDLGRINTSKNSGPQVPFPEMKELFEPAQKQETNRCIIPGCTNHQLVYKGMTYPVCGRKCFAKWQSLPRDTPFWN